MKVSIKNEIVYETHTEKFKLKQIRISESRIGKHLPHSLTQLL